ncbi:MAG TPA: hypothetical protein PKK84_07035, partial [Armatimonadota bacterium]|nr:hypothetical protein [Armatimonadota bacterium]
MAKNVGGSGSAIKKAINTIRSFSIGLATTFKHLYRPRVTMQYPEEKWVPYPRFRGLHQLRRYHDGLEMCIGCSLCAQSYPELFEMKNRKATLREIGGAPDPGKFGKAVA